MRGQKSYGEDFFFLYVSFDYRFSTINY